MKKYKKLLIVITVFVLLIVVSSVYLYKIASFDNFQVDETINSDIENENVIENVAEKATENETNSNSNISDETVADLKENLGKGTNGGANKVEVIEYDNGEKDYVYYYQNGDVHKVSVVNESGASGIEAIESDQSQEEPESEGGHNQQEEANSDEDTDSQDPQEEQQSPQQEIIEKSPGTVYERYSNMTSREKYAFYKSFESREAYLEWYRAAQAEYLALHPTIEVGSDQKLVFD